MIKLYGARSLLYRLQILQENIRWNPLGEIYKIYMLLHRSGFNISEKIRQTYFAFFGNNLQYFVIFEKNSLNFAQILMKFSRNFAKQILKPNLVEVNMLNIPEILGFLINSSKISCEL